MVLIWNDVGKISHWNVEIEESLVKYFVMDDLICGFLDQMTHFTMIISCLYTASVEFNQETLNHCIGFGY
jgi:hypothetical protein